MSSARASATRCCHRLAVRNLTARVLASGGSGSEPGNESAVLKNPFCVFGKETIKRPVFF